MFPIMGRVEGPIISDHHDRGIKLNDTYLEEDEGLSALWRRSRYFQARRRPKAQGLAPTAWCKMRSCWPKFAHAKTSSNCRRMRNEIFFRSELGGAFGQISNRASDYMHVQQWSRHLAKSQKGLVFQIWAKIHICGPLSRIRWALKNTQSKQVCGKMERGAVDLFVPAI